MPILSLFQWQIHTARTDANTYKYVLFYVHTTLLVTNIPVVLKALIEHQHR